MFLCNHDENDEEVDEEVDWYSGFCDYCNREIENRFRATRQPPVLGGWQGCFCSTVCAELNGAIPPKNDEIDDTQLLVLEKKLLQFKIYDRPDTQIIPVAPSVELELVENPVIVVNTTEEIEPSTQLASMLKRMGYTD